MRRARLRTTVNLAAATNRRRQVDKPETTGTAPTPTNIENETNIDSKNTDTNKAQENCESYLAPKIPEVGSVPPISEQKSSDGTNSDLEVNLEGNLKVGSKGNSSEGVALETSHVQRKPDNRVHDEKYTPNDSSTVIAKNTEAEKSENGTASNKSVGYK